MSRKKRSEEKRKKIRYCAYLCFREHGYYQTSIDDICTKAEISKGSLYWYYGAKIDIFIDILETWAREVIDELLEQFEAAAKNPDRILLLGRAFEEEFHRARAIVPLWVEFSLLGRTDKEVQISIAKFFRRARSAIAEILRETAHEHLSEGEIKAAAGMILGSYMGIILQEFADEDVSAGEWAQDFMGILRLIFKRKLEHNNTSIQDRLSDSRLKSILEQHDEHTQKMYTSVRAQLLSVHPEIKERWIQGWNSVGLYTHKLICLLKIQPSQIIISFRIPLSEDILHHEGLSIQDKKRIHISTTPHWNDHLRSMLKSLFEQK